MPYTCHLCADAEPATVLITPLQGGDTMAIGPDCMVMGLCGLLSVATQTDAEQLYDAILALRAQQDADAQEAASLAEGATCLALSSRADATACARPADHRGNHKDAKGHQWRQSRADADQVPQSEAAPA